MNRRLVAIMVGVIPGMIAYNAAVDATGNGVVGFGAAVLAHAIVQPLVMHCFKLKDQKNEYPQDAK